MKTGDRVDYYPVRRTGTGDYDTSIWTTHWESTVVLYLIVFVSGMTVLAIELAGSRLIAPYFGTSLFIWANLIGFVLLYLAVGNWLGGRLADRYPRRTVLYQLTAWAAFFCGLIPLLSRPILSVSAQGFASYSLGIFWGSLVGVVLLFLVPITLLGCVAPFAIRVRVEGVQSSGSTAGSLYALSTIGSLLGAFLPVLLLIPNIGTTRTFMLFALTLFVCSLIGLLRERRGEQTQSWPASRLWLYAAMLVVLVALTVWRPSVIRAAAYGELVYETESPYNYIQVVQLGPRVDLVLNEGHAVHSIYNPERLLTGGPWDYFLVAPYFAPDKKPADVQSMLMLGSAAGTTLRQYTEVYGPIPLEGVEIDPRIIDIGKRFFQMTMPNARTIAQDGRYYLRTADKTYDVIGIDAYRQPYIPFHMTTREFFTEIRSLLNPGGVTAINVGRTERDFRLVNALASTMKLVHP
ncbi:MAG: spermine synthase, partial [Dehalococcoidia bacterium]|nr:spermine synthase [Dehalococcoidia bacterium]